MKRMIKYVATHKQNVMINFSFITIVIVIEMFTML